MSGLELAAEIRKFNEKIKIILITAFMVEDLMISETYKLSQDKRNSSKTSQNCSIKRNHRYGITALKVTMLF